MEPLGDTDKPRGGRRTKNSSVMPNNHCLDPALSPDMCSEIVTNVRKCVKIVQTPIVSREKPRWLSEDGCGDEGIGGGGEERCWFPVKGR